MSPPLCSERQTCSMFPTSFATAVWTLGILGTDVRGSSSLQLSRMWDAGMPNSWLLQLLLAKACPLGPDFGPLVLPKLHATCPQRTHVARWFWCHWLPSLATCLKSNIWARAEITSIMFWTCFKNCLVLHGFGAKLSCCGHNWTCSRTRRLDWGGVTVAFSSMLTWNWYSSIHSCSSDSSALVLALGAKHLDAWIYT